MRNLEPPTWCCFSFYLTGNALCWSSPRLLSLICWCFTLLVVQWLPSEGMWCRIPKFSDVPGSVGSSRDAQMPTLAVTTQNSSPHNINNPFKSVHGKWSRTKCWLRECSFTIFPHHWFSDSYLYWSGFFLNHSANASISSFRTQLLKKQGLFNPFVRVLMPLKQCFYYFPDSFLKTKNYLTFRKKITTQNWFRYCCPGTWTHFHSFSETWALAVSIIFTMAFRPCCGLSFLILVKIFPNNFKFETIFEGLVQVSCPVCPP